MGEEPRMLGGRYELGDPLGRGGMAEVRRARDTRLGRQVAVKLLRIDLAGDPTFQARFRREAQASAGLNRPTLSGLRHRRGEGSRLRGVGALHRDGAGRGPHAARLLREERKIMPDRALELDGRGAGRLGLLPPGGIIHRDIKPANVMLTNTGRVKVMDFGIARAVADTSATMTQTAAGIGTAQYLSPEQARGETVDARSDIYSAGCLLYELLVGQPPFRGDSPVSVAYQHVRETPVTPSQLDEIVSADMDAIVLKALAKEASQRYQTASEMRDDINRLLAGQTVRAIAPVPVPVGATGATRVMGADPTPTSATSALDADTSTIPQRAVDDDPNRRRNAWIWGVAAFLLVLGLGYGAYLLFNPSARVATVEVPNVFDQRRDVAEATLTAAELQVVVQEVAGADDGSLGRVIKQTPIGGVKVPVNSTVTIQVNIGPEKATIPNNLVGKSLSDVKETLDDLGFANVDDREDSTSTAKANSVLSTNPAGGATVTLDTPITVVYAPGTGTVPNFYGLTKSAAEAQADRDGFSVTFSEEATAELEPGRVFKQSPEAGEEIKRSEKIKLVLSKALPSTSPSPSATPTSTP